MSKLNNAIDVLSDYIDSGSDPEEVVEAVNIIYDISIGLLYALKTLREDMRMLKEGEWDGSEKGAQDSINVADIALERDIS